MPLYLGNNTLLDNEFWKNQKPNIIKIYRVTKHTAVAQQQISTVYSKQKQHNFDKQKEQLKIIKHLVRAGVAQR